jgi:hypothetical protein
MKDDSYIISLQAQNTKQKKKKKKKKKRKNIPASTIELIN